MTLLHPSAIMFSTWASWRRTQCRVRRKEKRRKERAATLFWAGSNMRYFARTALTEGLSGTISPVMSFLPLIVSRERLICFGAKGIGFSGAVGIGLFVSSGENIATAGPAGAFIAFCFAGLIVFSVMRCLAEMVSVRPMKGALIDFPSVFVDEALGFAVGISYW